MTERATRIAHGRPHILYGVERADYVTAPPAGRAGAGGRLSGAVSACGGGASTSRPRSSESPLAVPPISPSRERMLVRTGSSRTASPT